MHTDDILTRIYEAPNVDGLLAAVQSYAENVGMDGAYLMHYHPASGLTVADDRPGEWRAIYNRGGFIHFDPIAVRAFQGGQSFTWEECVEKANLTGEQRQLMSQARDFGLNQGFHVLGTEGDYENFTCGYYNRHVGDFIDTMRSNREKMETVGQAAKVRMSELALENANVPSLTPREKQCLELAAAGKTNEVVGAILGISGNTVNGYIKSACVKLNVHSKVQAIVKAVQLKIIFPINL